MKNTKSEEHEVMRCPTAADSTTHTQIEGQLLDKIQSIDTDFFKLVQKSALFV